MADSLGGVWMQKIWRMLGIKNPGGPPIPRKELIKLLKRLRKLINEAIVKLEKDGKAKAPARPRARRAK